MLLCHFFAPPRLKTYIRFKAVTLLPLLRMLCLPGARRVCLGFNFHSPIQILHFTFGIYKKKKKKNHKRGDVASIRRRWKEVTLDHCASSWQTGRWWCWWWLGGLFDSHSRCCRAHIDFILLSKIATLHPAAPVLLLQTPLRRLRGKSEKAFYMQMA